MRIAILCDGDKCLDGSLPEEARRWVMVRELQLEHVLHIWGEEMKKAVIIIRDRFTPTLEDMAKLIIEFWEPITLAIEKAMRGKPKWYNPTDRNNYRKIHHMALRRVVRCRQRESRHRYPLDGLRTYITVFDEIYECV